MKKYNIEKNAKFLNAMAIQPVERLILFLAVSFGLFSYVYELNTALIGFFTFIVYMEGSKMLIWMIHSIIHCVIAKKRGVPHGLKED